MASPATRAARACRAEIGNTRSGSTLEGARRLAPLQRDLRLPGLAGGERVFERIDLVEDDEAGRRLGAEVIAPDRHVALGDAGIGTEDEDGGVRRGQEAERQLGLGADGVEARRVEHDQALLKERMRVVDEGVPPGRHLDLALVVARRVVVGGVVVPEAECLGLVDAHPLGVGHLEQLLGQRIGIVDIELDVAPGARLAAQLAEGEAFEAGLDGQQAAATATSPAFQPSSTGHIVVRPGRRRQDAAAGIGKEDGVDELRLAARELGHEGHHQLLVGQPLAQPDQLLAGGALGEVVLGEELRKGVEMAAQRAAPAAEGIETGGEGRRHAAVKRRRSGVRGMVSQACPATAGQNNCSRLCCGPFARRTPRRQRFWQPGQKKVARPAWTMRRTVPSQRMQGRPARP